MINLFVIALAVAFLGLASVYFSAPHWFTRSLHRHRLWRLHDRFVHEMIDGHLPRDHPAVRELYRMIRWGAAARPGLRALDISVRRWARQPLTALAKKEIADAAEWCNCHDLSPKEVDLIEGYRRELTVLMAGYVMLGSWIGLATVALFVPRARREVLARQQKQQEPAGVPIARLTVRRATDEAVEESKRGQRYRERVESVGGRRLITV